MELDAAALSRTLQYTKPVGGRAPLAMRLDDLYGKAEREGLAFTSQPLQALALKLMELPPQTRDYVIRSLARGEPAVVDVKAPPGSPSPTVQQLYFLVQPTPPNPAALPAAAQEVANTFGPTQQMRGAPAAAGDDSTPWARQLAEARRKAGVQPSPFMPGQHGAMAYRDAARQKIADAFAARRPQGQMMSLSPAMQAQKALATTPINNRPAAPSMVQNLRHMARDSSGGSSLFNRGG